MNLNTTRRLAGHSIVLNDSQWRGKLFESLRSVAVDLMQIPSSQACGKGAFFHFRLYQTVTPLQAKNTSFSQLLDMRRATRDTNTCRNIHVENE